MAKKLARSEAIAKLNDQLRRFRSGGRLVITNGTASLPNFDLVTLLLTVAKFSEFNENNDPFGERDFGAMKMFGATLYWKIDYYDSNLEFASSDPADPNVTVRVLTVMLASEY